MIKPSQIDTGCESGLPFCNTFGRSESEMLAWMMTLCCQRLGDRWQPLAYLKMREVIQKIIDSPAERTSLRTMLSNPFLKIEPLEFVEKGWGRWTGEVGGPLELTEAAIKVLASKWLKEEKDVRP